MESNANKKDFTEYMDQLGNWVERNSKSFVVFFSVFVLAVGVYWSYSLYKSHKIKNVAKTSGLISKKITLLEEAVNSAKDPEAESFKENLSQEISKIDAEVEALIATYPAESLTDLTLINWAGFLDKQGQTDKALDLLNKSKPAPERKLSALLEIMKAKLYLKTKDQKKALSVFESVLGQEEWKTFHAEALIQKALIEKENGDLVAAKESLERAQALTDSGGFNEDAKKYLRLIKIQSIKSSVQNKAG